jgi:hypothetical protein
VTDAAAFRTLGRSDAKVPPIWQPLGPRLWGDEDWSALLVGREALDRRGETIVREALAAVGRSRCDLLIAEHIDGGDLKAGWPMHRLQQVWDKGLCRFFALRTTDALEAEWIATHTPVHAVLIDYTATNMAARYRVFAAAQLAGTAVLAVASSSDDLALQRATPEITASLCDTAIETPPLKAADVESLWQQYSAEHPAPPKLKGTHPPEE